MGTGLRLLLLWLLFFFYKSSPFLGTAPSAPPADRAFPAGLSLGLSRSALSHVTHLITYSHIVRPLSLMHDTVCIRHTFSGKL